MVSSGERYLFLVTIDFRYFIFTERLFFCQSPLLLLEYSCFYYWFGVTFYILRYCMTFCYVCWHVPNIIFFLSFLTYGNVNFWIFLYCFSFKYYTGLPPLETGKHWKSAMLSYWDSGVMELWETTLSRWELGTHCIGTKLMGPCW